MAIFVQTIEGAFYKVSDDPAKFVLEPNTPFPGWMKIICENGDLIWFNSAHVIAIGQLLEAAEEGLPKNASSH